MKNRPGLCLAVCGLLFASGCGGMGELKEVTSVDGKYKVLMPGTPTEKTQPAGPVTLRVNAIESRDGAVIVGYIDMQNHIGPNETDEQTQTRLDGAVAGAVGNVRGTGTQSSRITLDGKYPGRELKADVPEPKGVVRARIWLVDRRLYQVVIMGKSSWTNSEKATKILDSFQLTQ